MTDKKQPAAPGKMLPAPLQQKKDVLAFLDSPGVKEAIAKVVPKHLTQERMVRVAITSVMSQPKLVEAAAHPVGRASLLNAMMRCSQAGLEPDGRLAHLIPFWNSKENCYCVQVIFDYKGLIVLAKRNGIDAKGVIVREKDRFQYVEDDGTGKTLVHHEFNPLEDRGEIVGVYSRAVEGGKSPDYEFMTKAEVDAIRARSRAANEGPWVTDYPEMAKKCPLRRHSKRWELQPEIREVINADDDTPPPLQATVESRMVRPMFEAKNLAPELTNGNASPEDQKESDKAPESDSQPDAPEQSDNDGDLGPQSAPEPPPGKPRFNVLKVLRDLCKMAGIAEGKLLEALTQMGTSDGSSSTLEEFVTNNEKGARLVCDDWARISASIKGRAAK
jgi:recombination protein RecT